MKITVDIFASVIKSDIKLEIEIKYTIILLYITNIKSDEN